MKPYKITLTDDADLDIQNISDYISSESFKASLDFLLGVYKIFDTLEYFPESWKEVEEWLYIKVYEKYYIIYDLDWDSKNIDILRIIHSRNYPEYSKYVC